MAGYQIQPWILFGRLEKVSLFNTAEIEYFERFSPWVVSGKSDKWPAISYPPGDYRWRFSVCQRAAALSSVSRASTQRAPSGVVSRFQKGARVFR